MRTCATHSRVLLGTPRPEQIHYLNWSYLKSNLGLPRVASAVLSAGPPRSALSTALSTYEKCRQVINTRLTLKISRLYRYGNTKQGYVSFCLAVFIINVAKHFVEIDCIFTFTNQLYYKCGILQRLLKKSVLLDKTVYLLWFISNASYN